MAPKNFDSIDTKNIESFNPASIEPSEELIVNTQLNNGNLVNNKDNNFKPKIVWRNVLIQLAFHIGALYGIYLCFYAKYQTLIFC